MTFLEKLLEIPLLHLPDRVVSEIGDCNYPLIAGDGFCDDEVELESEELYHLAAILKHCARIFMKYPALYFQK